MGIPSRYRARCDEIRPLYMNGEFLRLIGQEFYFHPLGYVDISAVVVEDHLFLNKRLSFDLGAA